MNDQYIVGLYVLALVINRSAGSFLALFVFATIAYTCTILDFESSIDDVYLFPILAVAYIAAAGGMIKAGEQVSWMGCLLLSSYYLFFSFDCWINADTETWVWRNHENIVGVIHVLIMLLLGKVLPPMVRTRFYLFLSRVGLRKILPNSACINRSTQGKA